MARRVQIVESQVPRGALAAFRTLARQPVLEELVTPKFAAAFERWLNDVARQAALRYPRRSGKSAAEIYGSARVRGASSLSTLRGYFLVSPAIAANEYGAIIEPVNATKLAIPLPSACYPNGVPRRRGPRSWVNLGTFVYKSKTNGNAYIAYKQKTTGKLVLLYLLVDSAQIKPKRILRNAYDDLQPRLFATWASILQAEIQKVYSIQLEDAAASMFRGSVPRRAGPLPSHTTHANNLLPRYKR